MASSLTVIVNPISGTGRVSGRADYLRQTVLDLLEARHTKADVWLTDRPGHAHLIASQAVSGGMRTVVAWGGDGTVNEVAGALAFTATRMAIVPQGSGNGLARALGIPRDPARALDVALGHQQMAIDVGELDGRRFVNAAGVGLDAAIAHRFAVDGAKRGLRRYVELTMSEVFSYQSPQLTVVADGGTLHVRPLLLTLANGTQFGNGAVVAASAKLDDGRLDLVIADGRSPIVALLQAPMLFLGGATRLPGVTAKLVSDVAISSAAPIRYHVDGEPGVGGTTVRARVHARCLQVVVPQPAR